MMAMLIWLSMDSANPCRKTRGSEAITSAVALQSAKRRRVSERTVGSRWLSSRLTRPHQAGGPDDEHQDHQQIGEHRRCLRDGDGQDLPQAGARCDVKPRVPE